MREELLDLLACPSCRGELKLESASRRDGEVIKGRLTCRSCGATYPVEEGIPRLLAQPCPRAYRALMAYYDAYAPLMDRNYHNPRIAYMREVEDACIRSTRPSGTVLDIGCGTGRQAILLAELGCRVVATDISMGMLLEARRRLHARGLDDRVELVQASADALPFRPEVFDRACSIFGAFNHAPRWLRGLRQVHETLKAGGTLLMTVLNRLQLTWWADTVLKRDKKGFRRRLATDLCYIKVRVPGRKKKLKLWTKLFSPLELEKALRSAGFRTVRIGSVLIFLRPKFSYTPHTDLRGLEVGLARLEEKLRWLPPFSYLGAYLIALAGK